MAQLLTDLHLADLHALAAGAGIDRYRLLPRARLVESIEARIPAGDLEARIAGLATAAAGDAAAAAAAGSGSAASARRSSSRARSSRSANRRTDTAEPARKGAAAPVATQAEVTTPDEVAVPEDPDKDEVSGLLHLRGQGSRPFGFVYPGGFERTDEAAYVADVLVEEAGLRPADLVAGTVEQEADGRRILTSVTRVNGADPEAARRRPHFDRPVSVAPQLRDMLAPRRDDVVGRAVALLAPLVRGQRTLVVAGDADRRAALVRAVARPVVASRRAHVVVAAIDPDAARRQAWAELLAGSLAELHGGPDAGTTGASPVARGFSLAAFALERARRLAERREDVVLVLDDLTILEAGLASATADEADVLAALANASRVLPGGGALTVIAAAADSDDPRSSIVVASETMAELAVDPLRTRLAGESYLREPRDLARATQLREKLAAMHPAEASAWLVGRIGATSSNHQLLAGL